MSFEVPRAPPRCVFSTRGRHFIVVYLLLLVELGLERRGRTTQRSLIPRTWLPTPPAVEVTNLFRSTKRGSFLTTCCFSLPEDPFKILPFFGTCW